MKLILSIITSFTFIITLTGVCFGAPSCTFTSSSSTLPFGALNPASTANATATMTLTVTCTGNPTWTLTSNNGLYYNGTTKRMRNQNVVTQFLPYSVTFSPTSGKKNAVITGSGTILNSDYINAYIGPYTDQITLTITP